MVHFVCTGLPTSFILSWQLEKGYILLAYSSFINFPFSRSHISIQIKVRKSRMGHAQLYFPLLTYLLDSTCWSRKTKPNYELWMQRGSPAEELSAEKVNTPISVHVTTAWWDLGRCIHSRTVVQRSLSTKDIMKYKNKHSQGDFIEGGDRNYLPPPVIWTRILQWPLAASARDLLRYLISSRCT